MKTSKVLIYVALGLVLMSLFSTGLGGWSDMMGGRPILISREHAWNDGIYAVLVAIFLVLVSSHM